MAVKDWSTTASTNAAADAANGINFAEGQAPGSLNDSMRSLMAVIKGDFANSLGSTGYQKLPNGLMVQWGTISGITTGGGVFTFVTPFPSACYVVLACQFEAPVGGTVPKSIHTQVLSPSAFGAACSSGTAFAYYIAIGS